MGRLRNCIVALAEQKVLLYDTTIQYTYDASLKYEVCTQTWLLPYMVTFLGNHAGKRATQS